MFEFVSIHVSGNCDIHRVAKCFIDLVGTPLVNTSKQEGDVYMEANVQPWYHADLQVYDDASEFEDKEGMPFSRLPVIITFEPYSTPPGVEERQLISRETAIMLGKTIFEKLGYDCLVTESMQRRIAVFKSLNNHWL